MAASYQVTTQRRTVQVLSQQNVIDVQVIGFVTVPHGVYVEFPVPYDAWKALQTDFFIAPFALELEGWLATTGVVDASWVQDVDDSGLLTDMIEFVLQVPPPSASQTGPMRTSVLVPFTYFGEDRPLHNSVGSVIQPALDLLAQTAGL